MRVTRPFSVVFFQGGLALAWLIGIGCAGRNPFESRGAGGESSSVGAVSAGSGGDGNSEGGSLPLPRPGVFLHGYGDVADQHAVALAVNGAGEIALVGTASGTIDFGNIPWKGTDTDTDVVVAKLSGEGQALWSRRYGDSCDQRGGAVAHTPSGNVLLAGDFCGKMDFGTTTIETKGGEVDLFVAVIDTLGEDVYSRRFGGKGAQIARAAAVDSSGNAVVVGSYDQAFDPGTGDVATAGLDDSFVLKLDPKGNLLWSRSFGGPESDLARAIAIDAKGNIIVGGSFGGSVDFGGGPLTASAGQSTGFMLVLDPDGKHLWSKSLGGDAVVNGVAVSVEGTIAATGTFTGTMDFGSGPTTSAGAEDLFLAVMDGAGAPTWGRTFGGPKSQRGTGVSFGIDEEVAISGTSDEMFELYDPGFPVTYDPPDFMQYMVFAVKLSAPGTPLRGWSVWSPSPMESVGLGLSQNPAPGVVLAGSFQEWMADTSTVKSEGGWDMFVARQQ